MSTTPTQSLIREAILVGLDYHDGYNAWPRFWNIDVNCFSQEHNNALLSSEPNRNGNLAAANLRFNTLRGTAASLNNSVKYFFEVHKSVLCPI